MSNEIDRIDFDETEIISNLMIDSKYRILQKLSKGGMGSIFIAEQMSVQRKVALKVISSDYIESKDAITRFFSEVEILATVQHSNIVKLIDFGKAQDSSLYIVMELLNGETLQEFIQERGTLSIESVIALGLQISSALVEVHSKNIIHRDVKPGNVFIKKTADELFTVKLIDFGLGKELQREQDLNTSSEVVGSPMYMAPEQIESGDVDERSDIYSLGLTLYFALTGETPFQSKSLSKTVHAQLTLNPKPIPLFRKDVVEDDDIVRIITRCIEKKPEDRFHSSLSLLRAIRKAQRNHPGISQEPLFTEEMDPESFGNEKTGSFQALSPTKKIVLGIQVLLAVITVLFFLYVGYRIW